MGGGCRCGLGDPYVLWDSRVWYSEAMGIGGRAMPNLGIGGSLWDLDVTSRVIFDGRTATWANHNDSSWGGSGEIPWSSVGGLPCEAPFTMMIAFGNFPTTNDYAEIDMLFRNGGQYGLGQAIGYLATIDAVDYSSFVAPFHGFAYTQWNAPFAETPGNADILFRNKVIAVTVDGINDRCHKAYRNTSAIAPHDGNDAQEEFFEFADPGDCEAFAGSGSQLDGEHFFYFGEDLRMGGASPGDAWSGVVGAAMFRGCPTANDMAEWEEYFFGSTPSPLPPYVNPYSYTGGYARWTDGTYAYHEFRANGSLVPIPGQPLPANIDIFMVGGGGGSAGYIAPSQGGGGAGGEVIQVTAAAPASSQAFVMGTGGGSRANGGNSTFMGYTARGGLAGGALGGNGWAGTTGGVKVGGSVAGTGGASQINNGGNAVGTLSGVGGLGVSTNWAMDGVARIFGSGGNGGGNSGSTTQSPVPGGGGSNNNPVPTPNRGGGAGGRIGSSLTGGFQGATGSLIVRHLLA